jgi:hypothetical protein
MTGLWVDLREEDPYSIHTHIGPALAEQVIGAIRRPENWHLSVTFCSYAGANAKVSSNSPEPLCHTYLGYNHLYTSFHVALLRII